MGHQEPGEGEREDGVLRSGATWTHPDFGVVEEKGARILVRAEAEGWVRYCLDRNRGLHAAAGEARESTSFPGRFPVHVIPAKVPSNDGAARSLQWAVRHYARGGRVFASLLGDRYLRLGLPRPFLEIAASEGLRARGIPTPRVMAAAVYPQGLFYRGDLVTELVPGSTNLAEDLFDGRRMGPGGAADRQEALRATGLLVRMLGQAGVRHRDLNARNVVLEWKGAAPRAHILDLDRCDMGSGGSISPESMLTRLRRSLRKWERRTGLNLSAKEWTVLEQAARGE